MSDKEDKDEIWDNQLERVYDAMADAWIMIWTGEREQWSTIDIR